MRMNGDLNFEWSQTLIQGFVAAGVRAAVTSPGSRSTPLTLALLREPALHTEVVLDERSAAFIALGMAKASGRPVLVVATSGSAPANWFPALVEARQAGVPLIFLSADRPPEMIGCGANQTLDQNHLFGTQVKAFQALATPFESFDPHHLFALAARMVETASWPAPGPVHLNQPFREPLVPETTGLPSQWTQERQRPRPRFTEIPSARPAQPIPSETLTALARQLAGRRGLILCTRLPADPVFAEAVTRLAAVLDCPILAEPLSHLRFGPHDQSRVLVHYDHWLRDASVLANPAPDWLIRFGPYPVTRRLQAVANLPVGLSLWVSPDTGWQDPDSRVSTVLRGDPTIFCQALVAEVESPASPDWIATFRALEMTATRRGETRRARQASESLTEGQCLSPVLQALPENCPVFVGNSLLIRDLDAESGRGEKPLVFFGNRGVSGIDGNVSTALGIALGKGRCVALLGDLTCQHDVGALVLARRVPLAILVFNNGGGGIFDHLPQAGLPEFEQGWLTPQAVDFAALAAAYQLPYQPIQTLAQLQAAMRAWAENPQAVLLEISIDRQASVEFRLS